MNKLSDLSPIFAIPVVWFVSNKVNPAKKGNIKFLESDVVKITIDSSKFKDYYYECSSKKYKLSTIDNCTNSKNASEKCEWGVC